MGIGSEKAANVRTCGGRQAAPRDRKVYAIGETTAFPRSAPLPLARVPAAAERPFAERFDSDGKGLIAWRGFRLTVEFTPCGWLAQSEIAAPQEGRRESRARMQPPGRLPPSARTGRSRAGPPGRRPGAAEVASRTHIPLTRARRLPRSRLPGPWCVENYATMCRRLHHRLVGAARIQIRRVN